MKKKSLVIFSIFLLIMISFSNANGQIRLFTGTYTEGPQKGLFIFDLDREAGTFKLVSGNDAGPNPSYFCISKKNGFIYAANEVGDFNGVKGGGVTALSYDAKTGVAKKIGELPVPNGGPAYIAISPGDDYLFLANYSGGSVAVVKLNDKGIPVSVTDFIVYKGEEGSVSHAHMVSFNPSGKQVYITDLGLDRVVIYNFDFATGKLIQVPDGIAELPKGSGPRHFVFNTDGSHLYVINELNSTITFFNVNKNGSLQPVQTVSTLRESFKGKSYCADIHLGRNDKFLYGSNRGENTIVTFKVGPDGKLSLAGHASCGGEWPRNFVIDPSGKYLIVGNQNSGNIAMFSIDEKTGLPTGPSKDYKITSPVCLKFSDTK
ncbi:MAG: lactonase family protein [Bacteroidales bacterium]|nr:lactonase family protein [Bacteroidales bacterium]